MAPPPPGETLDPRFARPRTLFFGVGAQKAATSWLDHYLRGHPEVCLPVRKEQHYWTTHRLAGASDRRARVARQIERIERRGVWERLTRAPKRRAVDRAWRLNEAMLRDAAPGHRAYADTLFQVYRGQPVAGEITPAYALLPSSAFAEMAALGRDVRFVFILRDPVDRLVSAAKMNVRKELPGEPPAVGALAARVAALLSDQEDPSFLRSRYDLTIARLEAAAARERILYLFYETLFRQEAVDRLCDFLAVARRPARFERRVNAAKPDAEALDPALADRALAALAPVYAAVRAKFGDEVPGRWRRPAEASAPPLRQAMA
jgi:hypothetical protein